MAAGDVAARAVPDRRYGRWLADQCQPGGVYHVVSAAPAQAGRPGIRRPQPTQRRRRRRAGRRRDRANYGLSTFPQRGTPLR